MSNQLTIVSLDQLVDKNHTYRKLLEMIDFKGLAKTLKEIKRNQETGRIGYSCEQALKMLVIQFMEDLSDRELERYLVENNAAKLFCSFDLTDKTPDFSYFSKVRKTIGLEKTSRIYNKVNEQLKNKGLIKEVFTFIDATHLISKVNIWDDRDRAIKDGIEKYNNKTIEIIASNENKDKEGNNIITADPDSRIGCKGKHKYWHGYKRHASIDMQSRLINKIDTTPANIVDSKGIETILPTTGAIFADKGYCSNEVINLIKSKQLHECIIKKNNMKIKNNDRDKWISKMRSPYEAVFSLFSKRTRYRGLEKNKFHTILESMSYNFKRLMKINEIDFRDFKEKQVNLVFS